MKPQYRKVAVAVAAALATSVSQASQPPRSAEHHPHARRDATDFYLFTRYEPGRAGYVTVLANYLPLQGSLRRPNYFALDAGALYEIHIDNTAMRARTDFQFRFQQPSRRLEPWPCARHRRRVRSVRSRKLVRWSAADRSLLNFRESYSIQLFRGDRRSGTSASSGERAMVRPYSASPTTSSERKPSAAWQVTRRTPARSSRTIAIRLLAAGTSCFAASATSPSR